MSKVPTTAASNEVKEFILKRQAYLAKMRGIKVGDILRFSKSGDYWLVLRVSITDSVHMVPVTSTSLDPKLTLPKDLLDIEEHKYIEDISIT